MLRDAAQKLVAFLEERFVPAEPRSLAETGVEPSLLGDLLLKNLYLRGTATGGELAEELGLPYGGVVDQLVEPLRHERLAEVKGGAAISAATYTLAISAEGRARARELLERSPYRGVAPVALAAYTQAVKAQSLDAVVISEAAIRQGLAHLVFNGRVLKQVGPAVNSGRAVFIHGHPGNGKTALATAMASILPGNIYIPHAVATDGSLIRVFDAHNHQLVPDNAAPGGDGQERGARPAKRSDRRWAHVHRPSIAAGGDLTLASLDLVYDPVSGTHEAPLQLKANGGMFLIDDFGRQQAQPRDLLNRWIMPLERRVDYLTLNSGKKVEVPFEVLIVFSTNLNPADLVDEAFLRRIPHKIQIGDPGFEEYREIFKRNCRAFKIPYDERILAYLLQTHYLKPQRSLRAVHPRDLLQQVSDIARFRRARPLLSREMVDEACRNYFL